ncbi:MAG: NCS2 family permease [Coxiellaceae bacterium]|nr:NCS2 family permease [Coxiellaceae bacterium]
MFERLFQLSHYDTTIKTEFLAGLATFLTMAYIVLVNPVILGAAGVDAGACFVATCVVTAVGCIVSGLLSNYPVAIAPGMALNAYFSYVIVQGMGLSWQVALGAVFISGLLFLLIAITPLRRWLIKAIPETMNMAIAAGLGLFIAMLALRSGGMIVGNKATLIALGNLHSIPTLLFFLGFCLIVILDYLKVPAALIIGILAVTVVSILCGYSHFSGVLALPPSVASTFNQFQTHALWNHQGLAIIFSFLLVAVFDSTGTFIGILHQAGLYGCDDRIKRLSGGLVGASVSTILGAVLGTSSTSAYCESAAGVRSGGRTGLTVIVVGVFFLLLLFFSPLIKTIPTQAAAAALLFVGCLMMRSFTHFNWSDMTDTIPSVITAFMIPFSFSIADGIGLGFISYVIIKSCTGKWRQIHPMLFVLTLIFVGYFISK